MLRVVTRDFTWQDGERLVRFGTGALKDAPELLGDGYVLLTTERGEASAPDVVERAAAVHHVPAGLVDEVAGDLLDAVDGQLLVSLGGGRVIDVAKALAAVVKELKPDLVLCGKQASDDDQGLVGPALAEVLGWPHVGMLTKAAPSGEAWELWREVEGGHEVWKATPPVVGMVHKSEKEPRYPSLPGIMKAKKKEIPEKDLSALGVSASSPKIEIVAMELPPQRGGGKVFKLDGDAKAVAEQVAKALHEEAKVL